MDDQAEIQPALTKESLEQEMRDAMGKLVNIKRGVDDSGEAIPPERQETERARAMQAIMRGIGVDGVRLGVNKGLRKLASHIGDIQWDDYRKYMDRLNQDSSDTLDDVSFQNKK